MSLPSGSLPNVKMMKAADLRNFDHLAKSGRLDRSAERRIFCKRQMRPATLVVGETALQSSTQGSAVPHQDGPGIRVGWSPPAVPQRDFAKGIAAQ